MGDQQGHDEPHTRGTDSGRVMLILKVGGAVLIIGFVCAVLVPACGRANGHPPDPTMSAARQFAISMHVYATDRTGRWCPGVDDQGRATDAYDSAAVIDALVDARLMPLHVVVSPDASVPPDIADWPADRPLGWIREHAQFDVVLPTDPADWHLRDDAYGAEVDSPMLVQRRAFAYKGHPIIVRLDGSGTRMPIEEVESLVKARSGKSLEGLHEPNLSDISPP